MKYIILLCAILFIRAESGSVTTFIPPGVNNSFTFTCSSLHLSSFVQFIANDSISFVIYDQVVPGACNLINQAPSYSAFSFGPNILGSRFAQYGFPGVPALDSPNICYGFYNMGSSNVQLTYTVTLKCLPTIYQPSQNEFLEYLSFNQKKNKISFH